jgi:hypothetical protein
VELLKPVTLQELLLPQLIDASAAPSPVTDITGDESPVTTAPELLPKSNLQEEARLDIVIKRAQQ